MKPRRCAQCPTRFSGMGNLCASCKTKSEAQKYAAVGAGAVAVAEVPPKPKAHKVKPKATVLPTFNFYPYALHAEVSVHFENAMKSIAWGVSEPGYRASQFSLTPFDKTFLPSIGIQGW